MITCFCIYSNNSKGWKSELAATFTAAAVQSSALTPSPKQVTIVNLLWSLVLCSSQGTNQVSRLDAFSATTRSSMLACVTSNQLSALLCDAGIVWKFSFQCWFFRSVDLPSSVHPRCRAGFLTCSYYCLLHALLICSASLAFRAAAVLAFLTLRILSFELFRVHERASTHPTDCLRTLCSTVRPEKERETCVLVSACTKERQEITQCYTKH